MNHRFRSALLALIALATLGLGLPAGVPRPASAQPTVEEPGIEIGPDSTAPPRVPAAPGPPAPPAKPGAPAARPGVPALAGDEELVDVDSLALGTDLGRLGRGRERLSRQGERLRQLEAQMKRDRVIRRRDDRARRDYEDGRDLVRMGTDVEVKEGDAVREVVVIGGDLVVRGEVEGDAVAIGGDLQVASGGRVGGDAVAVGGSLDIDPGAIVEGDQVEVGNVGPLFLGGLSRWCPDSPWEAPRRGISKVVRDLLILLVFLFIGWLAMVLAGKQMSTIADAAQHDAWRALLMGLLVLVLWPPAIVLSVITVVGIPVAIILLLAIPLVAFIGYLIGALALGRRVAAGINIERRGDLGHLVVGLGGLGAFFIIGTLFGVLHFLGPVALAFKIVGWVLVCFATLSGLGALGMAVFGGLRARRAGAAPPSWPGTGQPPAGGPPPAESTALS